VGLTVAYELLGTVVAVEAGIWTHVEEINPTLLPAHVVTLEVLGMMHPNKRI
jgi:hypothetical protein